MLFASGVDALGAMVVLLAVGYGINVIIVPSTFVLAMQGHRSYAGTASASARSISRPPQPRAFVDTGSMSRTHTFEVRVEFGDCDPAQIVYFPNFYRWMDSASRHFFASCGVPLWSETERTIGIIGTPLVDAQARFMKPATYGDALQVDSTVSEWRNKSFVMTHRVRRGADVLVECTEVRVFAERIDGDPLRIKAVPVPQSLRSLCE